MAPDNNKKYIAEVWVNNDSEEDFKKSVLKSIIDQLQHHGNGFDADMVDGMHWVDIKETIDELDAKTLKKFTIGYTEFSGLKSDQDYYLGFEGVKLYNSEYSDNYTADEKKLPWREVDEYKIPNIRDAISELYSRTYLGDNGETKTNKEIYEIFQSIVSGIDERLLDIEKLLDGRIVDGQLDANSVNGIRFFIYTPEQYKALERRALNNEEAARKLNSINNFFIIKSKEEIIEGGYPEGIYPNNPDTAVIDKHYKFRIYNTTDYDSETGEDVTGPWLQYTHEDCETWFNLCPTKNLVRPEDFTATIKKILEEDYSYKLNEDSLYQSLKQINITDQSNLPLAIYNRNKYIVGGVYNYVNEDLNTPINPIEIDNFQYLDLTDFGNELSEQAQDILDELNDYKDYLEGENRTGGIIGTINNKLNSLQSGITDLTNRVSNGDSYLGTKIQALTDSVNTLNNNLTSIKTWKREDFDFANKRGDCFIIYNEDLKVASLLYSVYFSWDGGSDWDIHKVGWKTGNNTTIHNDPHILPEKYRPTEYVFFSTADPSVTLAISPDGSIRFRVTGGKKIEKRFTYGTVFYKIK